MRKIILSLSIFAVTICSLQAQSLNRVLDANGSKTGMAAIRVLVANSVNAQTEKQTVIGAFSIEKGSTALIIASTLGYADVVTALIENGASVNIKDSLEQGPITRAGNKEVVDLLIKNKANINEKTRYGFTPLMVSASLGKADVAKVLIENNADLNEVHGIWSPLIIASYRNKFEVVELLVSSGAQVELKNKEGNIAFDFARTDEMKEVLYKYAFEKIGGQEEIVVEEPAIEEVVEEEVEEPAKGKKAKKAPKAAKPTREKAPKSAPAKKAPAAKKEPRSKARAEANYEDEDEYEYEDEYVIDFPMEDLSKGRTLIVIPSIDD